MRIINVVKIKHGVVDEIESFAVVDEQLSQEVVDEAEEAFIKAAAELGFDTEDDDDVDILMDNAYYSIANASVCFSWSDVENVQI